MLTRAATAVAMSKKREVRKKRSAGSEGTLVACMEAAIGDNFILALERASSENAGRNDNAYDLTAATEIAARAILRVRLETGKAEKSCSIMLLAPAMRGIFAMAIRKGKTVTFR